MKEVVALIDQLIEEHKQILQKFQTIEQVANDVSTIAQLDKSKEDFLPGKLNDQKQGLQNLQDSLEAIDHGLQEHFDREEKQLSAVLKRHRSETLASGLRLLLLEHKEIKARIAESKKEVAELTWVSLSREVRQGKAWGTRVFINHTRKLVEAHAQSEQELFHKIRAELIKA